MTEHRRPVETLRAGAALTVGDLTLLPIERVVVLGVATDPGAWWVAHKAPFALVVCQGAQARVIRPDGAESTLAWLRAQVPGLDERLARLPGGPAGAPRPGARPQSD